MKVLDHNILENRHHSQVRREGQARYLRQYVQEREKEALGIIRIYGPRGGISHNMLSDRMSLDRKNLTKYTTGLLEKGKIKRQGKKGPYFPVEEYYKDPLLNSKILAESFKPFLREKKGLVLNNEQERCVFKSEADSDVRSMISEDKKHEVKLTKADVYDFTTYRELYLRLLYLPARSDKSQIQKTLFELSNRVGAFVIRALIEATNQENYIENGGTNDPREQETLAQEYIKNAISTLAISLLPDFINLIETIPSIRNKRFETKGENVYVWDCTKCGHHLEVVKDILPDLVKAHQKTSGHTQRGGYKDPIPTHILDRKDSAWFIFNNTITSELKDAFRDIYPLLSYESDKIIRSMPNSRESFRMFTDSIYNQLEKQRTCKHEFKVPTITLSGQYVQRCSKCDEVRQVKSKVIRRV
jgi:hypothetical protein